MGAELVDDIFSKNEDTNVRSLALTCRNYTFFSCPKEMFDIFQRAANEIISGGVLPQNFITSALLSDMNYKTRMLVAKEYSATFFILSLAYAFTFLLFYSPFSFLAMLILVVIFFIALSYFGRESYWYGRIEGFKVDDAISVSVAKNTSKVYKNTAISSIVVFTALLAVWLFYLYFNVHAIVDGLVTFSNSKFSTAFLKTVFPKFFIFIKNFSASLSSVDFSDLKFYFAIEIFLTFSLLYFDVLFWLKKGIKESSIEVKEAYKKFNIKQKYVFEKALDILNKKK